MRLVGVSFNGRNIQACLRRFDMFKVGDNSLSRAVTFKGNKHATVS